jgi:hypothetical protein
MDLNQAPPEHRQIWVLGIGTRCTSTTRIRRREEDVERRGQSGGGDKGGRNSIGMHGVGLGSDSDIELKKLPGVEMDD